MSQKTASADLQQSIFDNGKAVFVHRWSGVFRGADCVWKLAGSYYRWRDDDEPVGPFPTFDAALDPDVHLLVGPASTEFACSELASDKLVSRLRIVEHVEPGTVINVNGDRYRVTLDGSLERSQA